MRYAFGILYVIGWAIGVPAMAQGVRFDRDLSPAEGLVTPQERPYRQEICLNGRWDFEPMALPKDWIPGTGVAPELPEPDPGKWETVPIKIPSPWNVNDWGGGARVGEGTNLPYAPGSVYYPSYPAGWTRVRMGWLRRQFTVPSGWKGKRIFLHFEAVAGDCVVRVNGKQVATHFDAYMPFDADVTDALKDGANELMVGVRHRKLFDKKDPRYPHFSATYPPGSNTSDLVGIWQDVFLEAVPPSGIGAIFARPFVDRDELQFEVTLHNREEVSRRIKLSGAVKEWINEAGQGEIRWRLGENALTVDTAGILLGPGEDKTVTLTTHVKGRLRYWSPSTPNLYTLVLGMSSGGVTEDCKTVRFGWRSFGIKGKDFYLNGEKIQCFGDLQHPFGPYICSRRFAWAWYTMIRDAGGNAVRLHAQPWPRACYDLADEMGLMVLDETALFGSSISLNLEEDITWKRSAEEIDQLVLRDRNHPSVIGWSVGNEMFAIALLNKPPAEVAAHWNQRLAALASRPALLDPTRSFVTVDGDKDLDGALPVWSKHFGHGLHLDQLPDPDKPLVVGESGATYYGKPRELFPFIGLKAYGSYYERSEALAIDAYQNAVQMARPRLGWFSLSELCWFGLEHLSLGYHDFSRLPGLGDGIFPGQPYEEGKPGYQFERIPPYVTTFNPGLDPALPVYKPLPLFFALKAAMAAKGPEPCPWDHFQDTAIAPKPALPQVRYPEACFLGNSRGRLALLLDTLGVRIGTAPAPLLLIDAATVTARQWKDAKSLVDAIRRQGGLVWIFLSGKGIPTWLDELVPGHVQLTDRPSTAMTSNTGTVAGRYFDARSLYFSELPGDRNIVKQVMTGPLLQDSAGIVLETAATDWSLFNSAPENRKCAQVVLYEHLRKPRGVTLFQYPLDKGTGLLSSIDYTLLQPETMSFWRTLCGAMGIACGQPGTGRARTVPGKHDLLMDGPVNY
jgi:beta-galactosidase